jgi:hypothetical protein
MMPWRRKRLVAAAATLAFGMALGGGNAGAANEKTKVSVQYGAFAPNAGGQVVYGLRGYRKGREIAVFQNQYLTAGDHPLMGALYAYRFPICDDACLVHIHVQAGAGVSTAGPLVEFLWGMEIPVLPIALTGGTIPWIPMLRIDFANHWIVTRNRVITWSYPLWVGATLPF